MYLGQSLGGHQTTLPHVSVREVGRHGRLRGGRKVRKEVARTPPNTTRPPRSSLNSEWRWARSLVWTKGLLQPRTAKPRRTVTSEPGTPAGIRCRHTPVTSPADGGAVLHGTTPRATPPSPP